MDLLAIEDHEREKRALLDKMLTQPWRTWRREGERVIALHEIVIAARARGFAA